MTTPSQQDPNLHVKKSPLTPEGARGLSGSAGPHLRSGRGRQGGGLKYTRLRGRRAALLGSEEADHRAGLTPRLVSKQGTSYLWFLQNGTQAQACSRPILKSSNRCRRWRVKAPPQVPKDQLRRLVHEEVTSSSRLSVISIYDSACLSNDLRARSWDLNSFLGLFRYVPEAHAGCEFYVIPRRRTQSAGLSQSRSTTEEPATMRPSVSTLA